MATTSAQYVVGLTANATPSSTLVTNDQTIGFPITRTNIPLSTIAYSIGMEIDNDGSVSINLQTGVATPGGAEVVTNGGGLDFQGNTLATMATLYGLLVDVSAGSAGVSGSTHDIPIPAMLYFPTGTTGALLTDDLVITAIADNTVVTVTAIGKPA